MQNKEKCLHATPLSETVLIPTIQIREGRKSKEKKERNEGGKETKRGEGRLEGKGEGGWGEEEEEQEQEGRDSTLKCFVLDLYVDRFKRIKIKVKHDFVCLKI